MSVIFWLLLVDGIRPGDRDCGANLHGGCIRGASRFVPRMIPQVRLYATFTAESCLRLIQSIVAVCRGIEVESIRPRSWNVLPGRRNPVLEPGPNFALRTLISVRYAPAAGAIGAVKHRWNVPA